jgi:tetratricopeptide (TPR) repeat protein
VARAADRDRNLDQADRAARRALEINEKCVGAHLVLVSILQRAVAAPKRYGHPTVSLPRRLDEAHAHARRATELEPSAICWDALGTVLHRLERDGEAQECFAKAVALEPNFAEAHDHLGNSLLEVSRTSEAAEHFRRAVEIRPSYCRNRSPLPIWIRTSTSRSNSRSKASIPPADGGRDRPG